VMILPAKNMEAARQLSQQTAEGLWDYQCGLWAVCRSIFHWGSDEAAGEPLSMALESARSSCWKAAGLASKCFRPQAILGAVS